MRSEQTAMMSFVESTSSTVVGFLIALLANVIIFPLFNIHPPVITVLSITAIMTVISIIRSFIMRRAFEKFF